ncbi:transposase [Ottowia sp. VDI28]|uniref:transposase n=1 Tax=unclassified Ottowia TaxID=2645081 RepID=UPI003C2F4E9C
MGCCALRHPAVAAVVEEALLKFDGERYRLICWSIMPNHVHVLLEPQTDLGRIVQSWKSFTGRWALAKNVELDLGIPGPCFWMRDYWDRYIRGEAHFKAVAEYIHQNPVKAGLVEAPDQWRWSSAWHLGPPSSSSALLSSAEGVNAKLELGGPRGSQAMTRSHCGFHVSAKAMASAEAASPITHTSAAMDA